MIIGITGTIGAGKGTVVEYIKSKGFSHYSASGFITEEIKRRGLPVYRENMSIVANDLRAKHGSGYIIESLLKEAEAKGGNAIIEAIHSLGEAETLRKHGARILGVDADIHLRYERILKRQSVKDNVSFSQFEEDDRRENESDDPSKHNIRKIISSADFVINNNGTLEELHAQVDGILAQIQG